MLNHWFLKPLSLARFKFQITQAPRHERTFTMFDPIAHPWVNSTRMFMPQGKSPYAITDQVIDGEGQLILCNGDAVTVEGAFTRPWMARTAPVVFYARSHRTGMATYVTASEVNLELPLGTRRAMGLVWKPRPFPETIITVGASHETSELLLFPETPPSPAVIEALVSIVRARA